MEKMRIIGLLMVFEGDIVFEICFDIGFNCNKNGFLHEKHLRNFKFKNNVSLMVSVFAATQQRLYARVPYCIQIVHAQLTT